MTSCLAVAWYINSTLFCYIAAWTLSQILTVHACGVVNEQDGGPDSNPYQPDPTICWNPTLNVAALYQFVWWCWQLSMPWQMKWIKEYNPYVIQGICVHKIWIIKKKKKCLAVNSHYANDVSHQYQFYQLTSTISHILPLMPMSTNYFETSPTAELKKV